MAAITLTDAQTAELRRMIRDLGERTDDLVKLAKCGVPCDERQAEIERLTGQLTALVQHFSVPGS
jgi:hypothetical protein